MSKPSSFSHYTFQILMTERLKSARRLWPYLAIVLAALLGHGLLLFNDGTYWDDWLMKSQLATGTWSAQYDWAAQMGLPVFAYFFWGLKLAGLLGNYKAVAFLSLFTSAILVYKICLRFAWVNRIEALGIALLSLVYPAYQTTVALSTLQYEVFYCLFLIAAWLLLRSEQTAGPKWPALAMRLTTLLLFFLAFNVNSLLVFYFPFLLLVFLSIRQARGLSWSEAVKTLPLRRLDFILLPFAYWGSKKVFFPTHGLYAHYNAIDLSLTPLTNRILASIKIAGYAQTEAAIAHLSGQPILWILILAATFSIYSKYIKLAPSTSLTHFAVMRESGKTKWFVLFGLLLLLSAVFPYSAVGDIPTLSGWNSRHALLVGLPMAVLIVAALRLVWVGGLYREPGRFDRRMISFLIGISLLTAFALSTIDYYVGWQVRAIKDRAIMSDLAETPILKKFSVFWIDDQFPAGGERLYRFYEWSSMFKRIWGGESRIGLQIQGYGNNPAILPSLGKFYTKHYNLSDFDPSGCQVGMTITRGPLHYSDGELVRRYFEYRYFDRQELPDFLHGVVHLDVQLLKSADPRCDLDIH